MKNSRLILVVLVAFLAGASVYTGASLVSSIQEKNALIQNIDNLNNQLASLEKQKQNFLQEIEKGKKQIEDARLKNLELAHKLKEAEDSLLNLDSESGRFLQEIGEYKSQIQSLNLKIERLEEEKDSLIKRLNILSDQSEAMEKLEQKIRALEEKLSKKEEGAQVYQGNRGFIIKEGQSTYPSKIKIEVTPAEQGKE